LTKVYRDNELEISEDIDNKTILEIKDKVTGALYYQKNVNAYLHDIVTDKKAINKKAFDSFSKRLIGAA